MLSRLDSGLFTQGKPHRKSVVITPSGSVFKLCSKEVPTFHPLRRNEKNRPDVEKGRWPEPAVCIPPLIAGNEYPAVAAAAEICLATIVLSSLLDSLALPARTFHLGLMVDPNEYAMYILCVLLIICCSLHDTIHHIPMWEAVCEKHHCVNPLVRDTKQSEPLLYPPFSFLVENRGYYCGDCGSSQLWFWLWCRAVKLLCWANYVAAFPIVLVIFQLALRILLRCFR